MDQFDADEPIDSCVFAGLAITLGDSPETENLGAVLWTSDPVSDLILVSSDPGLWFRLSQTCFLNLRPKFVV